MRWKKKDKTKKKSQSSSQDMDIPVFDASFSDPPSQQPDTINTGPEDEEITEYHETLYSRDHLKHQTSYTKKRWESTSTIESNVDTLGKQHTASSAQARYDAAIDAKVDTLLKKKGKSTPKKQTKPPTPEGYIKKKNKRTGLTYYTKK